MGKAPKEQDKKLKVVVFCGGFGTRMWPMSRQKFPKQFQPLVGEKSFFQLAVQRIKKGFSLDDIYFSIPEEQARFIRKQTPEVSENNIIAEPERRDTLGAVAYTTAFIDHQFPGHLMAIIWGGDHLVGNEKRFLRLINLAAEVCARENVLVKIDVKPEYPVTSLGWIKIGKPTGKIGGYTIYNFEKHIEKPKLELAEKMFKAGGYLINTGYYVWKPKMVMDLFMKYAPDCFKHIAKIKKAFGTKKEKKILEEEYHGIEKTSVDFGFFEKLPPGSFRVIPADIGWTDVGTWDLLYEKLAVGQKQNINKGKVEFIDSRGNLAYIPKKKIAAIIGVKNLVVVDTKDGLLVCKRGKSKDVKKFVNLLKEKGKEEYL